MTKFNEDKNNENDLPSLEELVGNIDLPFIKDLIEKNKEEVNVEEDSELPSYIEYITNDKEPEEDVIDSSLPSINDWIENFDDGSEKVEEEVEEEVEEDPPEVVLATQEQLEEVIDIIDGIRNSIPNEDIDNLTERVDQLQITGSDIFQQHGESLKELKKVTNQVLLDLEKLSEREIPEEFDPTDIIEDITSVKEIFYEKIADLRKEILEISNIDSYKDSLEYLSEVIQEVKNSIPVVPEVKYYDEEISNLFTSVNEVKENILELPIADLYKKIESLSDNIPSIPELSDIKSYDEDIDNIREDFTFIKLSIDDIESSIEEVKNKKIPEAFDPTGLQIEIEKAFKEIEKLKEQPVIVKEDADPLLPLDQKFVTFDDLATHYRTFINRVQQQLSSLGGGGEVNLRYLDDIDRSSISDGKVLSYDAATKKFKFISPGAASSLWSEQGANIYRNSNVGINSADPQVALDVVGDASITGVVTATSFYGDGSNLTGVSADNAVYATNAGISSYADVAGIATVAENLTGSPSIQVTNITGVDAIFTGNVSIAGTLTYEDATNIDAIGLVTARSGIEIGFPGTATTLSADGNATFSGVVTATAFTGEFVSTIDKTLEYQSGSLSTITTSEGTKTFYYDGAGILTGILGTGVYVSKEFTYDGSGNLISVNVL